MHLSDQAVNAKEPPGLYPILTEPWWHQRTRQLRKCHMKDSYSYIRAYKLAHCLKLGIHNKLAKAVGSPSGNKDLS
jgi:hypothetical protein